MVSTDKLCKMIAEELQTIERLYAAKEMHAAFAELKIALIHIEQLYTRVDKARETMDKRIKKSLL